LKVQSLNRLSLGEECRHVTGPQVSNCAKADKINVSLSTPSHSSSPSRIKYALEFGRIAHWSKLNILSKSKAGVSLRNSFIIAPRACGDGFGLSYQVVPELGRSLFLPGGWMARTVARAVVDGRAFNCAKLGLGLRSKLEVMD
jgi:hypothetical protein